MTSESPDKIDRTVAATPPGAAPGGRPAPPPAPDKMIGRVLGKCRLLKRLGRGGMGDVYLAEHQLLQKRVAIKILPPDFTRNEELVARFRREAVSAARLDHPNIVQIHDVGEQDGLHYIVMQFVEGHDLDDLVAREKRLDPKEAARIASEVAKGLKAAHDAGIVHRDIKPANILISAKGEIRIVDFGLAFEADSKTAITMSGVIMGTPHFLSPEQADGKRADKRCDLYSLGVCLYVMVTGERPFTGESHMAVLYKQINDAPKDPRDYNPGLPGFFVDIILKTLEKKPEKRYQDAAELMGDLEKFMKGSFPAIRKPGRRGSEASLAAHREAPSKPALTPHRGQQAKPTPRKKSPAPVAWIGVGAVFVVCIALYFVLRSSKKTEEESLPKQTAQNQKTDEKKPDTRYDDLVGDALRAEAKGEFEVARRLYQEAAKIRETKDTQEGLTRVEAKLKPPEEKRDPNADLVLPGKKTTPLEGFSACDLAEFHGCGHLAPHITNPGDSRLIKYPAEAEKEDNYHTFLSQRNDLAEFEAAFEIAISAGTPEFAARVIFDNEISDPAHKHMATAPLDGFTAGRWTSVLAKLENEHVEIVVEGVSRIKYPLAETAALTGRFGFRVRRGQTFEIRNVRLKVIKVVPLGPPRAKEAQELAMVRGILTEADLKQIAEREYAAVWKKLTDLSASLATEAARRELAKTGNRLAGARNVVDHFNAVIKSEKSPKLKLRDGKPAGLNASTASLHADSIVEYAAKDTEVTELDLAWFLITEGDALAALSHLIVGGQFRPDCRDLLDDLIDALLFQTRDARPIAEKLYALREKVSAANAKKIDNAWSARKGTAAEEVRKEAADLVKQGKRKEAIRKLSDAAATSDEAAKDLYPLLITDGWRSVFDGLSLAEWEYEDPRIKERVKIVPGEAILESAGLAGTLRPRDIKSALGLMVEVKVEKFASDGAVGVSWSWKDAKNFRRVTIEEGRIAVTAVKGGEEKTLFEKALSSPPAGKWVRLVAATAGESFLIFVDGELAYRGASATDALNKDCGIFLRNQPLRFRNVQLRSTK